MASAGADTVFVEKAATLHVEEHLGHGAVNDAKNASDREHEAGVWATLKKHRKAVFWSCVISMSIVMEGYDTILLGNFWGYPTCKRERDSQLFKCLEADIWIVVAKKYGKYYEGIGYQVPAHWQAGLSDSSTVGGIIGALFNGWASSRWGYKRVMIGSLFLMNMFVFIIFFAPNVKVLLVGELLCGSSSSFKMLTGVAC